MTFSISIQWFEISDADPKADALQEYAVAFIAEQFSEGFSEGELYCDGHRGYWKIDR